jgi:hypothetical protein
VARRKSFLLRVPPELYAALEKWADDELRSVNGQIEYVLASAVKEAGRTVRARRESVGEDAPENEES